MGNRMSFASPRAITRKLSRSGSTVPDTGKSPVNPSVDRLTKVLSQSSSTEDSVQGITCRAFVNGLFPKSPHLGLRLFGYMHVCGDCHTVDCISLSVFRTQLDKIMSTISDEAIVDMYVKVFAACAPSILRENMRDLILTAYRLAMENYEDGPQTCLHIHSSVDAVLEGAYHSKETLNVQFASHWIQSNCPRLVQGMHKYVVHILTTAYSQKEVRIGRELARRRSNERESPSEFEQGITTPVLEKDSQWGKSSVGLLPLSQVWLLSTSLAPVYSKPGDPSSPANPQSPVTPHDILMRMMGSQCPSHWVPLYNSNVHGCGSNRFVTHVTNYRGPTITLLHSDANKFLLATTSEWKESHLYWGGEDSAILQLNPEYHVLERGAKLMYLNCSIRGYPMGLRGGSDPRKPILSLNADFTRFEFQGAPYILDSIEVWGCGPVEHREAQVSVKKWQVKEAERMRVVKINADDWVDHPDRYLLELNGRQTYNSKK